MKFANHYSYTDIDPFEVVRVVSDRTLEIREMNTDRDDSVVLQFHIGGFAANCSNQRDQKWTITSDTSNKVIRIRLGKNGWKDAHGRRFKLSEQPHKFYDYNF